MRFLLVLPLFVMACDPSGGEGAFAGGEFAFNTVGATDACYDGALETVFLPEGDGSTNEFGSAIYVAGDDELPWTGTIPLQDPFQDLSVTVTGDASTRTFSGAENEAVELDGEAYPGCLVNFSISVALTIADADTVNGTATLNTSSFDEDGCPEVQADPCDITLDIAGTRN